MPQEKQKLGKGKAEIVISQLQGAQFHLFALKSGLHPVTILPFVPYHTRAII